MKLQFLFLLILCNCFAQEIYRPLSKDERKTFEKTANAIFEEYQNGNYGVIKRFGKSVLDTYSAIELDPDSKNLRPMYFQLKSMVSMASIQAQLDSLSQPVKYAITKSDYLACLENSQGLLTFLEVKNLDSLFKVRYSTLQNCQTKYFDSHKNLSTLGQIGKLKYYDRTLWTNQSKSVKAESLREFLVVSSSGNNDSLLSFQKRFPGLYTQDIETLKDKARSKAKLSVLRNPSKESINEYYQTYHESDPQIDKIMEDILYNDFKLEPSLVTANEYLLNFPISKRSALVKQFISKVQADSTHIQVSGDSQSIVQGQ